MARVDFAAAASRDIREIVQYLEDHGGYIAAFDFAASLERLKRRLELHPKAYAIRASLGPAIRVAVISPYMILYSFVESDGQVIVLRVVHTRRNVTKAMLTGP